VVERGSLPRLGAGPDEDDELVRVVKRRLDVEVRAAADQRAAGDEQLGEDRDRVGLGVRRDLGDDLAGQPVIGGLVGRRRPAGGRGERERVRLACGRWRRRPRVEQGDELAAHSLVISATAARALLSSQIDLLVA
jgi:hypothetical protein